MSDDAMLLADRIASVVTPWARAIPNNVSPRRTVYDVGKRSGEIRVTRTVSAQAQSHGDNPHASKTSINRKYAGAADESVSELGVS